MPVVPIYLTIDEQTYSDVMAGVVELYGLAKKVDSKRIVKHIPAVIDANKDRVSKAIRFVQTHKKGSLVAGGVIIVSGAAVGTVRYVSKRKREKLDRRFGKAFQTYLDAARDGSLTIDILKDLLDSIEAIEQNDPKRTINLNVSSDQFSELIRSVFDYTLRLAEANNFSAKTINQPRGSRKQTAVDLKYYLTMQKQILEQAA